MNIDRSSSAPQKRFENVMIGEVFSIMEPRTEKEGGGEEEVFCIKCTRHEDQFGGNYDYAVRLDRGWGYSMVGEDLVTVYPGAKLVPGRPG